jgi:hypothetical protein
MNLWALKTNINFPVMQWGAHSTRGYHRCHYCNIDLLTHEKSGFCCGPKGKYAYLKPLPALPQEYNNIISDSRISKESRVLNLIFSFAALETTHAFPNLTGPPSFVAVQGKIYHHIRPSHNNSSLRWLLFDGFMTNKVPFPERVAKLPVSWIQMIHDALLRVNPFVHQLAQLSQADLENCPNAHLELRDQGRFFLHTYNFKNSL